MVASHDGHTTSSLHVGKPDEVVEVEIVSTITIPPISSLINPLDQEMGSGVGMRVHMQAVGSASMSHV